MASESGLRARRVATAIRARVTELLARDVSDPSLAGLVVTGVELPDDLGIVWVKFRLLVGGDDEPRRKAATRSLARAASRLRRGLGPSLRMSGKLETASLPTPVSATLPSRGGSPSCPRSGAAVAASSAALLAFMA